MAKYGTNGKVVDRLGNMPKGTRPKGESLTSLYRDGDDGMPNQPFVKPASKTLDRGSVPVQPFQKGVPDILRAGVAQRALKKPPSLTGKVKLPSGSLYEQGGAPMDDVRRYNALGYAPQTSNKSLLKKKKKPLKTKNLVNTSETAKERRARILREAQAIRARTK
tara:strand:+ start:38 stop:529 length:492 start_codon:yes stop_codon:yes gene_type:complete